MSLSSIDVSSSELSCRKDVISNYLDIEKWKKLSNNIDNFNPDVIIFIARKMLRIHQVLKSIDKSFFDAPLIISNFAIDYLDKNYLDGKKIAIVDDSVNVGTTLNSVKQQIDHEFNNTQIKCFAVYQSENNHHEIDAILADDSILDIQKYRTRANSLSSSLNCLSRPVEIEFPIFNVDVPKSFDYMDFAESLTNANPNLQANRLDSFDAFPVGIYKFSVDVFPGRGVNDKWRFYFDDAKHILTFVPMAHYDPDPKDYYDHNLKTIMLHRRKSYVNSLVWGKKCWSYIQSITKLPDITLDESEVTFLFGTTLAKEMLSYYNKLTLKSELLEPLPCREQTLYFYNAYKNLDENLKINNIADCELFFDYFTNFFINLGKLVGEDGSSDYKFNDPNYIPDLNYVNKNRYARLCVGPTFNELLYLMNCYFTNDKKIDILDKRLHTLISRTLDRQIDQGFIVPVFDCYGRRIFRKGEPNPYNIHEIQLLSFLGLKPSFSNSREMIYNLPEIKRKEILDVLKSHEI